MLTHGCTERMRSAQERLSEMKTNKNSYRHARRGIRQGSIRPTTRMARKNLRRFPCTISWVI